MITSKRITFPAIVLCVFLAIACTKNQGSDPGPEENKYLVSYEANEFTLVDAVQYIKDHYVGFQTDDASLDIEAVLDGMENYDSEMSSSVTVYSITYKTPSNNFGPETLCSGIVVVPYCEPSRQVLAFHHTWMANRDFPSVAGFSIEAFLAFWDNVVIVPDYMGFGESISEKSPYFNLKQNFKTNLDMLYAAWELFEEIGIGSDLPLTVTGYSQGGYCSQGFQYMVENTGVNDVHIEHVISASAPVYMEEICECTLRYDYTEAETPPVLVFLGMDAALSLNIDFNNVFKGELAKNYPEWILSKQYNKKEIEAFINADKTPSKYLHEDFWKEEHNADINKLYSYMSEVSVPYDWTPKAPLLLLHGTEDRLAWFEAMDDKYTQLASLNPGVTYIKAEGKNHFSSVPDYVIALFATCNRF